MQKLGLNKEMLDVHDEGGIRLPLKDYLGTHVKHYCLVKNNIPPERYFLQLLNFNLAYI